MLPNPINAVGSRLRTIRTLAAHARFVRDRSGVSFSDQWSDLVGLRKVGLGAVDYYRYGLFDRAFFPDFASRATFRSYRLKEEFRRFSPPYLQPVAYEKHVFYRFLESLGFPVPMIHNLYIPRPDGFERHRALTDCAALETWLSDPGNFPVFGKPSNASHGFGALGMRSLEDGLIVMADGERRHPSDVAASIDGFSRQTKNSTYMLLEYCQPRADFQALCGSTLHSMRIVVLMRDGEPEIYRTTTLLPRDKRHVSNADGLTSGNMGGMIDHETGRVHHIIDRSGPDKNFCTVHPDTGASLENFVIEGWQETLELVMEASRAMSPFHMQHWDVALTSRGPVFLELNFIGDLEPMQMHGPPGAYTEQYRTFAAENKVW